MTMMNEFLKMAGTALGLFVCGCQPLREPFKISLCDIEDDMFAHYAESPEHVSIAEASSLDGKIDLEKLRPVLFAFVLEQNNNGAGFADANQVNLRVDIAASGGQTTAIWRQKRRWVFLQMNFNHQAVGADGKTFAFLVSAREDEWTNRSALDKLSPRDKAVAHLEIVDFSGDIIFSMKSREFLVKEFMPYKFWREIK